MHPLLQGKRVTLDSVLDANLPVYVQNNSGKLVGSKSHIVISFNDTNSGRTIACPAPVTWIPTCLSDLIPASVLRGSYDLRGMITKGYLEVLDPEVAEKILATPDAIAEKERLLGKERSAKPSNAMMEMQNTPAPTGAQTAFQKATQEIVGDGVSPKVKSLMVRFEEKELDAKQTIAELRAISSDFTRQDCTYILSSSKGNEKLRKFVEWAEKQVSGSSATENDDE